MIPFRNRMSINKYWWRNLEDSANTDLLCRFRNKKNNRLMSAKCLVHTQLFILFQCRSKYVVLSLSHFFICLPTVALVLLTTGMHVIYDARHKSNQQTINDTAPYVWLYPDSSTYWIQCLLWFMFFLVQGHPGEIGSMIRAIKMCQYITL